MPERRRVRVQAGVVKDQLNAALEPHGLFFAPELSTSNRATIGGMINTDACGQGSCLYGKTRDHVLSLTTVLLDGTVWTSRPLDDAGAGGGGRPAPTGSVPSISLVDTHPARERGADRRALPQAQPLPHRLRPRSYPRRARGASTSTPSCAGRKARSGFIAEAELNVLPIPKHSALVNIRYDSFDAALRDARALVDVQAASIETVDSRVLALARNDIVWHEVASSSPTTPRARPRASTWSSCWPTTWTSLEAQLGRVTTKLEREGRAHGRRGFTVARNEEGAHARAGVARSAPSRRVRRTTCAWPRTATRPRGMASGSPPVRRASGGRAHLGHAQEGGRPAWATWQGGRRPIPFVEDTAVPPEHLADYIAEFRAALDRRGLVYGMFGHVDAGVLHVRPAIDMTDPAQEPLIREISDEVAALTQKYGGVLWGEHGKGVRSEYAPAFFGPLYPCLQQIKAAFDPHDQLNPGKIAAPADGGSAADRRGARPAARATA